MRPCTCACSIPWEVAGAARGAVEAVSVLALAGGLKERGRREARHEPFVVEVCWLAWFCSRNFVC